MQMPELGSDYDIGGFIEYFPTPSHLLFSRGAPKGISSRWVLDTKILASDQRE